MGNAEKPCRSVQVYFQLHNGQKMGANWNIHGVKMIPISDFVALEKIDSCGREIFSIDLTVCMLQTRS